MKTAPVIAAANLILSPAAQIKTKAAALEGLGAQGPDGCHLDLVLNSKDFLPLNFVFVFLLCIFGTIFQEGSANLYLIFNKKYKNKD